MNLSLRVVDGLAEALSMEALIEHAVLESSSTFGAPPLAPGSARAFLERAFDRPETLVLVAEGQDFESPPALCLTAALEDPFTGQRQPMVLALFVTDELRHRGLARALIDEVTRLLLGRGFGEVVGRVGHNDDALISMGERWGFVRRWELVVR